MPLLSQLVCNVVGSVYPAYASYQAVLAVNRPDLHKQCVVAAPVARLAGWPRWLASLAGFAGLASRASRSH